MLALSAAAMVLLLMVLSSKILKQDEKSRKEATDKGDTETVREEVMQDKESSETEEEPEQPLPVVETETETEPEPEPVYGDTTILFTGDVLLYDGTLSAYQNRGIDGLLSEELRNEFANADILMINEEFPFSNGGVPAEDKQFTFRCDPVYISAFQEMGVDLVTLANNHTLDFGQEALLDSLNTLDTAGIPYVGAGRNLEEAKKLVTFEKNGKTFGFLGASRVWPVGSWSADTDRPGMFGTYEPAQLLEEIRKAKEVCDFVTVYVHWGIERNTLPEDYQRTMAAQYHDAGADLVIGSHPHVLQGAEIIGKMPVFYSLGNFIFNTKTYDTAVVRVTVRGDGETEFSVLPARSDGGRVSLLTGDEGAALFSYLNTLCFDAALDEEGKLSKISSQTE